MVGTGPLQGTDRNGQIDEQTATALLLTRMNTNSTQNGRKEVIFPVKFEGQVIILFTDCRDVLRGAGIDGAGIFTPDVLFKPSPVRELNVKALHGTFGGNILKK